MSLPTEAPCPPARHAVVIGASLAGMLAARVLTEHFDQVTLVERDRLAVTEPSAPSGTAGSGTAMQAGEILRKGVPQARHLHILLVRGRQILEELFPGLGDEAAAAGATELDATGDFAWLTPFGWGIRFRSDICSLACSRGLLDGIVRRRVLALPRLRLLDGTDATGLVADAAAPHGLALALRPHGMATGPGATEDRLTAALIVDASGRGSRLPDWLDRLGYGRPEETVVDPRLGYASRIYRRPPTSAAEWRAIYLQAAPPERKRAGVLLPIEGDRWIVTLGGGGGDYPPTDEDGFRDFAASLPHPLLAEAVAQAEPLTPIAGFRATENRLRHYERLARRPEGLVVLGDAACTFNPVYGQGMTTAALGAMALNQALHAQRHRRGGGLAGLAGRFQAELAQVIATPWVFATSQDFRYDTTRHEPAGWRTRLMQRYLDRLVAHTPHDPAVRRRLLEVFHMIAPPAALFRPDMLARALRRPGARPAQAIGRFGLPVTGARP